MTGSATAAMNNAMSCPASDTERLLRGILGFTLKELDELTDRLQPPH
jgi:hypothetical protein